ncbi:low-density lipoprotein receptor-related protein 4-like [Ptychodera flava]|uniref:low-density lipoprotein receptor-related protein 4-like n=1 Tax=Ptychodera flava TaxID=63121 RepID=UPI003969CDE3
MWLLCYRFVIFTLILGFHGRCGQVIKGSGLLWTAIGNGQSQLMFITGDGQSIYTNTTTSVTVSTTLLLSQAGSVKVGLAMDFEDKYVFWSDPGMKSIFRASLLTGSVGKIYEGISDSVEGIAVDWVSNKIYWTDASYNWIVVSDYDGDNVRTLIYTGLDRPRGITVDPIHGHLYWCDLGSTGKIEKSNLNGEGRQTIVSEDTNIGKIRQPNGLEIDYDENRLYWTDGLLHKIMSVDLDGSFDTVREVVEEKALVFPFDISLDQNYFFVGDHSTEKIWIIERANPAHRAQLVFTNYKPLGMTYYTGWRQPTRNSPCSTNNGGCQHLCVGDPSGHKCLCRHGFVLAADGFSCTTDTHLVPGHQVLFANDDSVCRLPVDFAHSNPAVPEHCFINGIDVGAMDYLYSQDVLYFHEKSNGTIQRALLRDDPSIQDIVADVSTVSGISVDWLANNLYWTDSNRKAIYVSKLDGSFKTVLVSENVDMPHGIAVYPSEQSLFWTDKGSSPRIEKSALSGRQRSVFISSELRTPSALTIDHTNNRLYWVDVGMNRIESIGTNGEQRKLISPILVQVFGLTIFQDHVYWSEADYLNDFSHVAGKQVARRRLDSSPGAVLAFDKSKQTLAPGPCDIRNGGCDEICAPTTSGAECLCSRAENSSCSAVIRCPRIFFSGEMTEDCVNTPGNTCQFQCDQYFRATTASGPVCQGTGAWDLDMDSLCVLNVTYDHFLLVADALGGDGKIFYINLLSPTFEYVPLPLTDVSNPVGLDYDPVESKVYWTDTILKSINRASLDGSDREVIASTNVQVADGIAIDVEGRKLYWTDTGIDQITRADLDGSNRQPIVFTDLQEPRAITLDNPNSRIFWSDWGATPKIERANQDGSGRAVVVSTDLGWPNGLALDSDGQKLFWCDARTDRIEYINLVTNDRQVLITLAGPNAHPFGLTLTDEYIYWTEWNKRQVQRADKTTGYNVVSVGYPILQKAHDIHVFAAAVPKTTEPPQDASTTTRTSSTSLSTSSGPPTPSTVRTTEPTTMITTTTEISTTTTAPAPTTSTPTLATTSGESSPPGTPSTTITVTDSKSGTATPAAAEEDATTSEEVLPSTLGRQTSSTAKSAAANKNNVDTGSSESSDLPLIGAAIGIAVLIIAIIFVLLYCRRYHKACFAGSSNSHTYWDPNQGTTSKEKLTMKYYPDTDTMDFGYLLPKDASNQYDTNTGDNGRPSAPPAPKQPSQPASPGPEAVYSTIDAELSLPEQKAGNQPGSDWRQTDSYVPMRPL